MKANNSNMAKTGAVNLFRFLIVFLPVMQLQHED
jgi:hypothetical protein